MLVEDQDAVRNLLRLTIGRQGYRIVAAGSGEEAVRAVANNPGPIHLLVSDVHLPGMSGPELAHELRKIHPGVKLLFLSGYGTDTCGQLGRDAHFLQKPFQLDVLVRKVKAILETEPVVSHP